MDTTVSVKFLGDYQVPHGKELTGQLVGDLSGAYYDESGSKFWFVSDDSGLPHKHTGQSRGHPRLYPLSIKYSAETGLQPEAGEPLYLKWLDETVLDRDGNPTKRTFNPAIDPIDGEAIVPWAFEAGGAGFVVSSEGVIDAAYGKAQAQPSLFFFSAEGFLQAKVSLPKKFQANFGVDPLTRGIYHNQGGEAMATTPAGELWVGMEGPLRQDGALPTIQEGALTRLVEFSRTGTDETPVKAGREFLYPLHPIPNPTGEGKKGDNGLVDMVALSETQFLVMERSFVKPTYKNHNRIYLVDTSGATDVSGYSSIQGKTGIQPVKKQLILDLDSIVKDIDGQKMDNTEVMVLGPQLPNGNQLLLVTSDDNYNPKYQRTIFLAFELDLGR